MDYHAKIFFIELFQDTDFEIILKKTGNIISLIIIKSDIDAIGIRNAFLILIFGDDEYW